MVLKKRSLVLFVIAMLWGCQSWINITNTYDPDANFADLKTYAWVPDSEATPGGQKITKIPLDGYLRNAVENTLAAKGYQKVTPDTADFEIIYHAALTKTSDQTLNDQSGFTPINSPRSIAVGAYDVPVNDYPTGTLIIDIVNPKTRHLIWRGSAQGQLNQNPGVEERKEKIDRAVKEILKPFPPK